MPCSFCGSGDVVYVRDYEGVGLCGGCFKKSIEDKVKRTISRYRMLEPHDRVAVAVSGGKDSLTLLAILAKLERRFPEAKLTAITVDEGIRGYRDEAISIAEAHCRALGVEQVVVSFRELFGTTTEELASTVKELKPCSYCGVLRRKAINKAAEAVGATKIATAHNLDDEVQTVLLNILHGDISRLARSQPVLRDPRGKFITRIKPLCEVPEREIVLYAYLSGFEFQGIPCPYGSKALRSDIREMLNRLEQKHPGIKFTAYRSAEKLRALASDKFQPVELKSCERCGDPTPNVLCEGCLTLEPFMGARG